MSDTRVWWPAEYVLYRTLDGLPAINVRGEKQWTRPRTRESQPWETHSVIHHGGWPEAELVLHLLQGRPNVTT